MLRYFIAHPTMANLLMAGLILCGIVALPSMIRETFPKIPLDTVTVETTYKGASAEDVAETVCTRVEDAVDAVENLDEIRCDAQVGFASTELEMVEGGNIARFLDDAKTEIDAIDDFPAEVEDPVVKIAERTDFVAALAVSGPMSVPDLKLLAEDMKTELQALPILSEIQISGFSDRQIRIEISQDNLARHGISLADIADTVSLQSVTRPVGEIDGSERVTLLRLTEERRDVDNLEDLVVIGTESGAEVRLGDIADIFPTFEDDYKTFEQDGRRAALIRIFKSRSDDTLDAVETVRTFMAEKRAALPPGVTITLTQDVSSVVRDRLDMLIENGWQGALLVAAVLWVFFGTRFSFWVTMGLPVSFFGAFALMALFGISINMLTMVGLLISIGLLMDDALVIAENVATHHRRGKSPLDAAWQGTLEILPGVSLSFLTTVAVFGALAFIGGDLGQMLRFVPIILIMTLSVSLLEAFLILPNHLSHSLGGRDVGVRFRQRATDMLDSLSRNFAGNLASFAVRYRYAMFGGTVFLFLGAVSLLAGGVLKFQSFPDLEGDVVVAQVLMPQGTPLSHTRETVSRITGALETIEEELGPRDDANGKLIRHVSVEYGKNTEAFETGPHVATVTVDLLSAEIRPVQTEDILNRWRALVGPIPDVLWLRFADFQIGAAGRPLEFRLSGLSPEVLKQASTDFVARLSSYKGVSDVADDLRPGKPELQLTLRSGARATGLTASSLADQVAAGFQGNTADEIQVGSEDIEVDVRFAAADRNTVPDLEDMLVTLPDGQSVPLTSVATVTEGRGWGRLNRIDGRTTVTVIGEIDRTQANVAEVIADMQAQFFPDLQARYPGLGIAVEGEQKTGAETQGDIKQSLMIGIAFVFLFLCFQFRSYALPPLIILLIPASFIGVVVGHILLGFNLSMPSMVGFVALAGVAVNGAILMVEFVGHEVATGQSIEVAARAAAERRFRAIFLTSVTTIFGLLPLLAETSIQAQVLQPMVVSLVFGLVAAGVIGMLLVPCLLAILADFGWIMPQARKPEDTPQEQHS